MLVDEIKYLSELSNQLIDDNLLLKDKYLNLKNNYLSLVEKGIMEERPSNPQVSTKDMELEIINYQETVKELKYSLADIQNQASHWKKLYESLNR